MGWEILSTGGTAQALTQEGVPVTPVEKVTGFPEILDGRVKTLHPAIHGGLLADLSNPDHITQAGELGIQPFDLLVSTLPPSREPVAPGGTEDESVEQIDIGGPAMVRAAAKNHNSVAVVVEPAGYEWAFEQVKNGGFEVEDRRR